MNKLLVLALIAGCAIASPAAAEPTAAAQAPANVQVAASANPSAPASPPKVIGRAEIAAMLADPAIRDHVGPSENGWDFTKPDGVPGFGPLLTTDRPQ